MTKPQTETEEVSNQKQLGSIDLSGRLNRLFKKPVVLAVYMGKAFFWMLQQGGKCPGSPFATFTSAGCRE